jgi:hypothetical protein
MTTTREGTLIDPVSVSGRVLPDGDHYYGRLILTADGLQLKPSSFLGLSRVLGLKYMAEWIPRQEIKAVYLASQAMQDVLIVEASKRYEFRLGDFMTTIGNKSVTSDFLAAMLDLDYPVQPPPKVTFVAPKVKAQTATILIGIYLATLPFVLALLITSDMSRIWILIAVLAYAIVLGALGSSAMRKD